MPTPLVTSQQVSLRLSSRVVQRIYDDDDDGTADADAVTALIRDASSKVRGKLGPSYDPDVMDANIVDEVVRITLDVVAAYAAQRHPEIVRFEWEPLMKQADKELMDVRKGIANLGTNALPEPALNTGGEVYSNDDDLTDPPRFFIEGGTGIF